MLVRMKIHIGGYRNGEEWPNVGGCIDLPDHEATDVLANGYAELPGLLDERLERRRRARSKTDVRAVTDDTDDGTEDDDDTVQPGDDQENDDDGLDPYAPAGDDPAVPKSTRRAPAAKKAGAKKAGAKKAGANKQPAKRAGAKTRS